MKLKVLVLADDCNPEWPSLPVVGYKYAKALAEYCDVVVVTQIRNRPNIEKAGLGSAQVEYLDTEQVAAPIARLGGFLRGGQSKAWTLQMAMNYPSYLWFERSAWKRFGADLRAGRFDLVHRITPMSPTLPSYMARRSPVPFILGPLNGNLPWPAQFRSEQAREREWLSFFRNAYKLLPYRKSTYASSACVLAAFRHTLRDLDASAASRAINFPEVGIDPTLFVAPSRPATQKIEVLFAGRLVPYKLAEVVVRAFAESPRLRQHQLTVVGGGPELPRLESLIAEHGLATCVTLLGQKSQGEVAVLMQRAHVFAFPSIRELGAGVVVEAMASGMACVVVDYGGPAELVDADRGVKVPMGDLGQLVERFRASLEALVSDPGRIERLGAAAASHALRYYSWSHKAGRTMAVYSWVLSGRRGSPPGFWD